MLPRARKKDLIIERLEDETLVYDLKTDRAHCLNHSASLVWRSCDGKTAIPKIAKRVAAATGAPPDDRFVRLALQSLQKANLIDERSMDERAKPAVSRRELLKSLGKAAAITLPVVTSIVAPEAAQAASCIPAGDCGDPGTDGRCCCGSGACNEKTGKCAKGKPCF